MKGIQLPPVSAIQFEEQDGIRLFQIIDGKQRLTTMLSYVRGEFPIVWKGEEYFFNDLHSYLQSDVGGDIGVRWDIAYHYDDVPITDQMKIDWFEMINFSGTPQDVEHLAKLKQ